MQRGDFRIEDVRVVHCVLNAIILLEDLEKYKDISMMTLTSWYDEILPKVRFPQFPI